MSYDPDSERLGELPPPGELPAGAAAGVGHPYGPQPHPYVQAQGPYGYMQQQQQQHLGMKRGGLGTPLLQVRGLSACRLQADGIQGCCAHNARQQSVCAMPGSSRSWGRSIDEPSYSAPCCRPLHCCALQRMAMLTTPSWA